MWCHGVMSQVEGEHVLKIHQELSYLVQANVDGKSSYQVRLYFSFNAHKGR